MIKPHIDAPTHIKQPYMFRQFNVEKEYLLKGLHPQHITRVNGNLSTPLLAERSARKLVRRSRNFALDHSRYRFGKLFRKPDF